MEITLNSSQKVTSESLKKKPQDSPLSLLPNSHKEIIVSWFSNFLDEQIVNFYQMLIQTLLEVVTGNIYLDHYV